MGSQNHVLQGEQRAIRFQRFPLEDVQSRPRNATLLQRHDEGRLIDDGTPRRIDHTRGGFHTGEFALPQQMEGLRRQGCMHRHDVRPAEQLVEADQADPQTLGRRPLDERIECQEREACLL